jgi:hypothetical protein
MTALVCSVERYRTITGDIASATGEVESAITDAQALLEDALGRQVGYGTRTERLLVLADPISGAPFTRPSVAPVHSATDGTVDGDLVRAVTPASSPGVDMTTRPYVDLTYVGGWDRDITDRTDTRTVPACIERDVAMAAKTLLDRSTTTFPEGATSVANGDVKVTFGGSGAPGASAPDWSRQTMRWARRRL